MEPPTPTPRRAAARPLRVLFVCTANRARSVYAEHRARALLTEPAPGTVGQVRVASAGVRARDGDPVEDGMAAQLQSRGLSAASHASAPVTDELLRSADLVVTFEFAHHMAILDAHPDLETPVLGFTQLMSAVQSAGEDGGPPTIADLLSVAPVNSMGLDVEDPYRRGTKVAAACAQQIDEGLAAIVPFLRQAAAQLDPADVEDEHPVWAERAVETAEPEPPRWWQGLLGRGRE
ncbi:arsenate reductase/protein-tyrosine-phosphatase family protein [Aestuariimicrobium ganziense]|uniref:arsenate reductase/protein-tyrosine-phosphatase family protein n=1 Tax=Aestuariimicrobium ganziense TaxID=2773677 RepID=UPI001940894C|nr:hypothetical protein [Aestuariimicrobium ganziense]